MPAATLIVASLAALEPPHRAPEQPLAFLQTSWSLTASPLALAAAPPRPIIGPSQVAPPASPLPAAEDRKRDVTVLPAPADELDDLKDPAAEASPTEPPNADTAAADAPAAAASTLESAPESTGMDPLEDELTQQLKPANDPLEGFNRISFSVSMALDKAVLRPLSLGFQKVTPKPVRDGMRNVLSNWGGPFIIINDLLQLKPKRAARSLGRFLLNTLLGIGGLFDVAKEKKFNIQHHSNSFSNTLGFYGLKLGPYIYLPILGPTTLLDQVDRAQGLIPLFDNPIFRDGRGPVLGYLSGLDERANNDQELKALLDDSIDPYATFRTTWLQDRQGQIHNLKAPDGRNPGDFGNSMPPASPLDDPLTDPAGATPEAPVPESATPAP
ncbi:MAG: VacJ family lipoprotein [Novosphingobium sp.]